MSKAIKIKQGLDIRLQGDALHQFGDAPLPETFAIRPPNFHGLTPKLSVKQGAQVKAGSSLFYDKQNDAIQFTSPVSGEVVEIVRGAKRRILEVKILADKEIRYEDFGAGDPGSMDQDAVREKMLKAGVWPFLRQRPFANVADPSIAPKAIVVSCTDTHPLAPNNNFCVEGNEADFQTGLDALNKIADCPVYLTMVAGKNRKSGAFLEAKGVEIIGFSGPHPAGNVGVQMSKIDPINKGEYIWYTYPQDVVAIGRLFNSGKFDARRVVALTGSEVSTPQYYNTMIGASIAPLVNNNIEQDNVRYVSGNCLTGEQIPADGYLGFYDTQITVLPEGNEYKFLLTKGWLGPGFDKFSASGAYPTKMLDDDYKWRLDTNNNGEPRAFVVTGQYEEVFPFDIYPQLLVKACITQDIDMMENLGIYEVDSEDFALCEYVCTSKIETQRIVREGLDLIKEECT